MRTHSNAAEVECRHPVMFGSSVDRGKYPRQSPREAVAGGAHKIHLTAAGALRMTLGPLVACTAQRICAKLAVGANRGGNVMEAYQVSESPQTQSETQALGAMLARGTHARQSLRNNFVVSARRDGTCSVVDMSCLSVTVTASGCVCSFGVRIDVESRRELDCV